MDSGQDKKMDAQSMKDVVAKRLLAIIDEFKLTEDGDGAARSLGEICGGANSSAASNWLQGYNFPKIPQLIALCDRTGITLDWLLRGTLGTMNVQLGNRLNKLTLTKTLPKERH